MGNCAKKRVGQARAETGCEKKNKQNGMVSSRFNSIALLCWFLQRVDA